MKALAKASPARGPRRGAGRTAPCEMLQRQHIRSLSAFSLRSEVHATRSFSSEDDWLPTESAASMPIAPRVLSPRRHLPSPGPRAASPLSSAWHFPLSNSPAYCQGPYGIGGFNRRAIASAESPHVPLPRRAYPSWQVVRRGAQSPLDSLPSPCQPASSSFSLSNHSLLRPCSFSSASLPSARSASSSSSSPSPSASLRSSQSSSNPASSPSSTAPSSISVTLAAQQRLSITAPSVTSLPASSSSVLTRRQGQAEKLLEELAEITTMDECLSFFSGNKHHLRSDVFLALLKRMQLVATVHLSKRATRSDKQEAPRRDPGGGEGEGEEAAAPRDLFLDAPPSASSSSSLRGFRLPPPSVCRAYFHRFSGFRDVQRHLLSKVDSFPVCDLLAALDILQQLSVCPRLLLRAAAPLLLQQLPQLSLEQVVLLLRVYVHPNSSTPVGLPNTGAGAATVAREVTHWLYACGNRLGKLDSTLLADLADAGSRVPVSQVALLRLLLSPVRQRMHAMSAKQLSLVLHAYAKHPSAGDDFVLQQGLTLLLSRHSVPAMSLPAVLRCIWAASVACSPSATGTAGRSSPPSLQRQQQSEHLKLLEVLLTRAEPLLLRHPEQLDGQAVATLVWACSRGGGCLGSAALLQMLHRRTLRVHSQMSPQGLSNTLWGFATSLGRMVDIRGAAAGSSSPDNSSEEPVDGDAASPQTVATGGSSTRGGVSGASASSSPAAGGAGEVPGAGAPDSPVNGEALCVLLFQHVEPHVLRSLARCEPQDLATLSAAYALLRCGSEALHTAVQQLITENWADEMSADQLVRVAHAYAILRGSSRMFSALQVNLLRRLETFTVHGLCDVIWSYVVMRYLDEQFLEMCLSLVPLDRVAGDDRCALLYPAASEIALALPSMDQIRLQRMRKYTREAFWELQLLDFPTAFAASVAHTARVLTEMLASSSTTSHRLSASSADNGTVSELLQGEGDGEADSQRFDRDAAEALRSCSITEAFDFLGYLVDVWLQRPSDSRSMDGDQMGVPTKSIAGNAENSCEGVGNQVLNALLEGGVALLCHTHATVHRETGKPLGPAIMRHRFLKRKNVPTVNLLWDVWKTLPTTKARVEWLHAKIVRALREEQARQASRDLNRARVSASNGKVVRAELHA